MDAKELNRNIDRFAKMHNFECTIMPVQKNQLIIGKEYVGLCRNADVAMWDGSKFVYSRYKFGDIFQKEINHYEDDDGYDVFIPFLELQY